MLLERAASALGILISSGAAWRNVAKNIEKEASKLGIDGAKKSIDGAAVKIEKHVSGKSSGSAYETAKSGGEHAGTYKTYSSKTNKELEKSIKSQQKNIDIHNDKIANPDKYVSDFYKKDKRYQEGLIKRWKNEVSIYEAEKEILEGILIEKGIIK